MQTYTITPSMRFRALAYFLGWQGGTIHQLAAETGLRQAQILDEPLAPPNAKDVGGWFGIRTCERAWRTNALLPKRLGDWGFFSSAIRGFWATGPLDGLDDRWPDHPVKTGLMRCEDAA